MENYVLDEFGNVYTYDQYLKWVLGVDIEEDK